MRRKRGLVLVSLAGAILFLGLFALCAGAVRIPPGELLAVLTGETLNPKFESVLWHLRVPRVLLGLMAGASLSVAGTLLQGLFRNPLADPGLIGVSSGAALGAVFVIILGGVVFPDVLFLSDVRLLPVAAFFGALAVTLFIQALAGSKGSVSTLLLLGIAVNSLADAVIGLSTLLATDTRFPSGHLEVLGRRIGKWWGLPLRSVWDWPWSRLFSRPPSMRWLSVKPRPAIWGIR